MAGSADTAPGYHGKLVAKGDFVTRRLPRGFLDPWDSWLQDVIGGSRARMGEAWLDAYLTSPIWRFALSAGLCGEGAAAGWFAKAEELVQSALADAFDFDGFDAQVAALGPPPVGETGPQTDPMTTEAGPGLRVAIPSADAVDQAYRHLGERFLSASYPRCSLWWTSGSHDVAATLIASNGLPSADGFAAFLDGRWGAWGWDGGAPAAAEAVAAS